ncbi:MULTISPECIES: prepilin-type N-terminal cleavage/methylation domain-containing protein [Cellulomonas]|uniref:prepilin-type N-terminal cleavage/methylation domain-containing protein n=1 Tax=Cellulomonas TaxID=1707 RepID=UPI0010A7B5F2|nr:MULTISPECIES: prepilin-type N-terminal cleavage/methylation domain-containing protein [Cellulomonas]
MKARRVATDHDDGFTLMELLVAMMVITVVLLGLMVVQTSAMVTTAQTKQRTQGTAVANQTMEQLRALPWLVLSKGLHAGFATATGGDPNVAGGRLRPAASPTIDEPLVTDSTQAVDKAPLSGTGGSNRITTTDPAIPGVEFTSRSYVTRSAGTGDDVLTLTVITSWRTNDSATEKSVVVRSEAYAPAGGCGDPANQPFLGACQALLSASGGSVAPATTVTPATFDPADPPLPPDAPILPGTTWSVGSTTGGQIGVGITSQQSTAVDSSVLHGGVQLTPGDPAGTPTTTGGSKVQNAASDDVGSSGAAPANPPVQSGTGSASHLAIDAPPVELRLATRSGVSGTARASMSSSCASGIPAGQGCGSAGTSGGAAGASTLSVPSATFGLATLAGGGTSEAYAARFTSAVGTTATGCTVLSGAGCIAAGSTRTLGDATFATGPWAGGAAPSGLVRVTGYQDRVMVQRGQEQRTVDATITRSATVQVWNGTGYTPVAVDKLTNQTVTGAAVSWTGGGHTVTAVPVVTVTPGMAIAAAPDPLLCGAEGCSIDADTGTVSVSVTWRVSNASGLRQAFTVATNLGTSRADASFKAAPGA